MRRTLHPLTGRYWPVPSFVTGQNKIDPGPVDPSGGSSCPQTMDGIPIANAKVKRTTKQRALETGFDVSPWWTYDMIAIIILPGININSKIGRNKAVAQKMAIALPL